MDFMKVLLKYKVINNMGDVNDWLKTTFGNLGYRLINDEEQDNLSKFGQSFQSKVVSLLTDDKFLDTLSEI